MIRLNEIAKISWARWVGVILILFFAGTAVIASEQHNHNIGEKAVDCPAHVLSVSLSAWQPVAGFALPPLAVSTFAGESFSTSYFGETATPYFNKAPPLFS